MCIRKENTIERVLTLTDPSAVKTSVLAHLKCRRNKLITTHERTEKRFFDIRMIKDRNGIKRFDVITARRIFHLIVIIVIITDIDRLTNGRLTAASPYHTSA